MRSLSGKPKNIICFSPYRWDFALQRPQHLLLRFAEDTNVYFLEDPIFDAQEEAFLSYATRSETLWKVVPHLKADMDGGEITTCLTALIDQFFANAKLDNWIFWYYNSSALSFTKNHKPKLVIYDCMRETLAMSGAADEMNMLEKRLLERSDLVINKGSSAGHTADDWDNAYHHIAIQISNTVTGSN